MSANSEWQLLMDTFDAIAEGRIGLTEGVAKVVALHWRLGEDNNDLFDPFIGVDSDLHVFPTGAVRAMWSPIALIREDKKRATREQHYRPLIMKAIENLRPSVHKYLEP